MNGDITRELGNFILFMFEINDFSTEQALEILSVWIKRVKDNSKIVFSEKLQPSIEENLYYARLFDKKLSDLEHFSKK